MAVKEQFESYYNNFIQKVIVAQQNIRLSGDPSEYNVEQVFPAYFKTFDCLHVEEGWQLGCYYFYSSTGGNPVIYARKANENIIDLISEIDNGTYQYDHRIFEYCETVKTIEHIKVTEKLKGLFQLLILHSIGSNFALYWHAVYGHTDIICSQKDLDKLLYDHDVEAVKRLEIKKINNMPTIEETNDTLIFKLLVFNAWNGLQERTYSVNKEFPHKISLTQENLLIEYCCSIMF